MLFVMRSPEPDIFFVMPFPAWLATFCLVALGLTLARHRVTRAPAILFTLAAPVLWWVAATSDYRAWYDAGDSQAAIAQLGIVAGWITGGLGLVVGALVYGELHREEHGVRENDYRGEASP